MAVAAVGGGLIFRIYCGKVFDISRYPRRNSMASKVSPRTAVVCNQNDDGIPSVRRDVAVVRARTSAHSEKRSASHIDRRRVVTTDEFRMFSANGKQQTAGLNCTAKFPRAAQPLLYLSFAISLSPSLPPLSSPLLPLVS